CDWRRLRLRRGRRVDPLPRLLVRRVHVRDVRLPAPRRAAGRRAAPDHVGAGGVRRTVRPRAGDRAQPDAVRAPRDAARPRRAARARLYRSGDLARRNGTTLAYLGRRDRQVQVNGFRVELAEIEGALAARPGVAAAGVAATADSSGGYLVAAVVPAGDAEPDPA